MNTDLTMEKIYNPDKNKSNFAIVVIAAMILHLLIIALLVMGSLFSEKALSMDGDSAIKAMMIDLSVLAAPEQSLAENSPNVTNQEDLPVVVEKPITTEEVAKDNDDIPDIIVEKKPAEPTLPTNEPTLVMKEKPKKPKKSHKKKHHQQSSQAHVKQEIITEKRADVATASAISDNNQFLDMPTAISRGYPEYPRRALDMRIDGHVIVLFDIDNHGRVDNIRITEAKPNNIFNRSVIQAMKRWKYPPRAKRDLKIKIIFNRNKSIKLED